jgi:8-oxo-dGTP pyrophosphatase MutT (NUDIX family)
VAEGLEEGPGPQPRPLVSLGTSNRPPEIEAAGGVLLRPGPNGPPEVLVVHRPKYDDWSFPKGKLHRGETHEDAAIREVEEESGVLGRPVRELEPAFYTDPLGRWKHVRYWLMDPVTVQAFVPSAEVDEIRWLPEGEAAELLTHSHDRRVLQGALRPG